MTTQERQTKIADWLKANYPDNFNADVIDENILIGEMTDKLMDEGIIDFAFEFRENESDAWLQCEYWSEKLNKTIIMDYDAPSYFDNHDNPDFTAGVKMAEILADYQERCEKLEQSIIIKPKKITTEMDMRFDIVASLNLICSLSNDGEIALPEFLEQLETQLKRGQEYLKNN